MPENSKNDIKLQMLNEYENILNQIFNKYSTNEITLEKCISIIKYFKYYWEFSRIDFKNFGNETNHIEFIENKDNIKISRPPWFKNDAGEGYKIESDKSIKLKIKLSNDGRVKENLFKIWLRGVDFSGIDRTKKPIYINFTSFLINNESIFNENKLLWHNQPFIYEKKCNNEDVLNLEINFETIYDYFPKLKNYFNPVGDEEELKNDFNEIKKYIEFERLLIEFEKANKKTQDLFNSYSQYETILKDNEFDSYHDFFLKTNIINLTSTLENLTNKVESLERRFAKFEKDTLDYEDSSNFLISTIYLDYKLSPNTLLNNLQTLCNELLSFVDNICKKHKIEWWLDYGNLLGAVRHENFIPWDDDMDIGMMREDYHKFIEVMYDEINSHELDKYIDVVYRYRKYKGTEVNSFIQLFVKDKPNGKMKKTDIMAGVDIFPYDYMIDYTNMESFGKTYNSCKTNFYKNLCNGSKTSAVYMGLDYNDALNDCYTKLNLNYEKEKYIIPGVEGSCGYKGTNLYEVAILETEKIFPLINVKYGDYTFYAPNDFDTYLKKFYGDYMKIPKTIRSHGRANNFRNIPHINKKFEELIYLFKSVNSDF